MTKLARMCIAMGLVASVAIVGGCSSGGAGGPVTAGSDSSSGQAAAAIFIQQWAQILWGLVTSQTGTQTPTFGTPTPNPDGSISVTFTGADGTVATLTQFPDGSAKLEIAYADGSAQEVHQSVPVYDGVSKTTIDWQVISLGLEVNYRSVVDNKGTIFDISDDSTVLGGSSKLPRDVTQNFDVVTENGETTVASKQSDGSKFTMSVPLAGPDFILPDFTQTATGTYGGNGFAIEFDLDSTATAPTRWARLSSDLGSGLTGVFFLEPDFAGSGRLLEDGSVIAVMSWDSDGKAQVSFVVAGRSATSPAGAAIDFLVHRWQTLTALLAPAPGAASVNSVIQSLGAQGG